MLRNYEIMNVVNNTYWKINRTVSFFTKNSFRTNLILFSLGITIFFIRYLFNISVDEKSSFARNYMFNPLEINYAHFYYIALFGIICIFLLIYAIAKRQLYNELKNNYFYILLLFSISTLLASFPLTILTIIQIISYICLNSILPKKNRVSFAVGIIIFLLINSFLIFLLYYQRPAFYPPEPDDSFCYLQYIGRMAYGLDDNSPSIVSLQRDSEEDNNIYDYVKIGSTVTIWYMPHDYYLWGVIYGLLNRYFGIRPELLFFISQIIGFCFMGFSASYFFIVLRRNIYDSRYCGLALALIALLSLNVTPVNFVYFRPYVYSISMCLLIFANTIKNKLFPIFFLLPLLILFHPIHILVLVFYVNLLFLFCIKRFKNHRSIDIRTILGTLLIFVAIYSLLTIFQKKGVIPNVVLYNLDRLKNLLPNHLNYQYTEIEKYPIYAIAKLFWTHIVYYTLVIIKLIKKLSIDFNPLYIYIWIVSLRHIFKNKSSNIIKGFKLLYLTFIFLIMEAVLIKHFSAGYLLYILQILNFSLFYQYMISKNNMLKIYSVIICLGLVLLLPKWNLARTFGKINNFKNPYATTLVKKLDSKSVVFHNSYKYGLSNFLAHKENLIYRHAFFFQWLKRDLDLKGYDFNKSYIVAFDKFENFQKMLKKYIGDRVKEIVYDEVPRKDERKGYKRVIKESVFEVNKKNYHIKLENSYWPYLLYRIRKIG